MINPHRQFTLADILPLLKSFSELPRGSIGRWVCTRCAGNGYRLGVWSAGCDLRCKGCQTPDLQALREAEDISPFLVEFANTVADPAITGLTISGGEPMLQPDLVLCMIELYIAIKAQLGQPIDILLYSHFLLEEIEVMPLGKQILSLVSVLIDGPFVQEKNDQSHHNALAGSSNQRIHYLNCDAALQKSYEEYNLCRKLEYVNFRTLDNGVIRTTATGAVGLLFNFVL